MTYDTGLKAIDDVTRMAMPTVHKIKSIAPPYKMVDVPTMDLSPDTPPSYFTTKVGGSLASAIAKTGASYRDLLDFKRDLADIFCTLADPPCFPTTVAGAIRPLTHMISDLRAISGDPSVSAYLSSAAAPLRYPIDGRRDYYNIASDFAGALGTVMVDHMTPRGVFRDMMMNGSLGDTVACCLACAATHPDTPSMALGDLRAVYSMLHPDAK